MTVLVFIVILSILVFVHELGHFIAAKKAGILVEEFGFGLPPRLWGKKVGETIYSINLLPIGGFVRLYGEDGTVDESKRNLPQTKNRAFFDKPIGKRVIVLIAGVTMNVLLGILCFTLIYFKIGIPVTTDKVTVIGVSDNSPAQEAGLKVNDLVVSLNGAAINSTKIFIDSTQKNAGQTAILVVQRDDQNIEFKIIPRVSPPTGEGPLGVAITDIQMVHYPWWKMPLLAVREGLSESYSWAKDVFSAFKGMLVSLVLKGKVPQDIAGPIGIFQITGQATKAGWIAVIQFIGILSINLAVLNILPFPALDGGRLIFITYELIFKKRPRRTIEAWVNNFGMAILLGLMLLITINDIIRLTRTN